MAEIKSDASKLIDGRISELGDWRGKMLGKVRGDHQAGGSRRRRGVEVA